MTNTGPSDLLLLNVLVSIVSRFSSKVWFNFFFINETLFYPWKKWSWFPSLFCRSCICCNLPVTETVSHVEPGVFVFDCGK